MYGINKDYLNRHDKINETLVSEIYTDAAVKFIVRVCNSCNSY